jgi:hypothetical protein
MAPVSSGRMLCANKNRSPTVEEQTIRQWDEFAMSSAAAHKQVVQNASIVTSVQNTNEYTTVPTKSELQAMHPSMATTTLDTRAYAVIEQDSVSRAALGNQNTFGQHSVRVATAGSHDIPIPEAQDDDGASSESNHLYVIDTMGENPNAPKLPPPIINNLSQNRSISPAPSSPSSSEEEILFHGRRNLSRVIVDPTIGGSSISEIPADSFVPIASEINTAMSPTENHLVVPTASRLHSSVLAIDEPTTPMTGITTSIMHAGNAMPTNAASEPYAECSFTEPTSTGTESWDRSDKLNPPWVHRSKPGIGWLPQPKKPKPKKNVIGLLSPDEQDAVMRDFYENLRQQELAGEIDMVADAQMLTYRDLSQPNDPSLPDAAETSSDVNSQTGVMTREDLPSANGNTLLSDDLVQPGFEPSFACSSLSSSEFGSSDDDDDDDDTEDGHVSSTGAVYGEEIDEGGGVKDEEDETSSDTASDLEMDDREKQETEEQRTARKIARQEKRLRQLSQSPFLDGTADDESSDDDAMYDDLAVSEATIMHEAFEYAKTKPKKSGQGRKSFPSASALADALEQDPYNGFDIMDFDRPSLRRKRKGKGKARLDVELSDKELEQQLHTTWEKDRQAKKARKQRREEMRTQGLVGGSGKKKKNAGSQMLIETDGISLADVKQMIRSFLDSTLDTQDLPPMAKGKRLAVHRIVQRFGIKSDSRKKEPNRHITLTKTTTTKAFDNQIFKRASRKVMWAFPSSHDSTSGSNTPTKHKLTSDTKAQSKRKFVSGTNTPTKRGGQGGFSYRDGEIVGAGAAEIGADNRGRAMLEKMGWSSGMALGALDNKGILEPIAQVVKNSRYGLG